MAIPRILPPITDVTRPYWTGGAQGSLLIERCGACRRWQHPPTGTCGACGAAATPEPVSGTGTIFTFTVNHQQYHPEVPPPYVIAVVELTEQAGLRVPTNLVDCEPEALRIGATVRVRFEQHGEVFVPVFALEGAQAGSDAA